MFHSPVQLSVSSEAVIVKTKILYQSYTTQLDITHLQWEF